MHETYFSGGVFSSSIEGGRAGADIELAQDAVKASTKDGERFTLRYSDCNVEMGGFNNKMVFCRNEDRSLTIFTEDKKFSAALAFAAGGLLDDQLQAGQDKVKSDKRSGRNFVLICMVCLVVGLTGLYYGIKLAGSAAVDALPVSVDEQIGRHTFTGMDLGGEEIHDPVVVGAMEQIIDRLAPHAALQGLDYEVHVVRSEQVNAFALPGGIIVVYTGLIEQADQPEQVAGVLAHEISHATLRHGLERVGQSLGVAAAVNLLIGNVEGLVVLGAEVFKLATVNSYSRGQETEADSEGVRMLHAAKIDPLGLAQFFELLKEEGNNLPAGLEWISTHPDHDARIINIRGLVAELGPQDYKPIDVDWDDVRQRITAPHQDNDEPDNDEPDGGAPDDQ